MLTRAVRRGGFVVGRALRETGQALDRVGSAIQGNFAYKEQLSRHRRLMPLYDKRPVLGHGVFVAPSASLIGDVTVGNRSSIWYGAVVRGDVSFIKIGDDSTIGDRVVVHVRRNGAKPGLSTLIGNRSVISQGAIVHAATVEDEAMVDTGAVVMDGAVVGHRSILGPGSLLKEGSRIPSGELWAGSPAQFVRKLSQEEMNNIAATAKQYHELAVKHDQYHELTEADRENIRLDFLDTTKNKETKPERTF